ncbi:MAG: DegQ family serine endoprotease [Limisphaerales bacterium]
MKMITDKFRNRLPAMALASAVVLAGTALAFTQKSADTTKSCPAVNVPVDETSVPRDALPRGSYAPIVKRVAPAVVKIETTMSMKNISTQESPGFDDPFWRHFFGDQFGQMTPPGQPSPRREHGLGSGVIVTKDGYILTNNHVVDGASEVKVTLQDAREFTAKVIGRDPKSDVAVVKIDAKDLPVVPMADSDKVQVGDIVLAVGNPFGVGQTVTEGIVSAKNRGNMGIEDYEDFIQTDAAINPGNSGGALVDIDGRLIGINTAILSRSGGSQGVGFAIPSDLARTVMGSLVQYGHVTRGYLGVMIQDLTPRLAKEFRLKEPTGALVGDVLPDGPAAKAGFKDGDVVIEFDGKPVTDSRHLKLTVAETKPGSTVAVKVWRDGSAKTLDVTVKDLAGTEQLARNDTDNGKDTGTLNGVSVSDLDPHIRQQFNLPETVKGAVITDVKPDSPSAEAGLKPGEVIEEINRHAVQSAEEAVRLTENAKDKRTLVRVWEKGASHYVVVDESKQTG